MNTNHYQTTAAGSKPTIIKGFDRITLWLDRAELSIEQSHLRKHCTELMVFVGQMRYQARWKLRLEILQPSVKCIEILAKAMGHDVATLLTYVEIAVDTPANSKEQALQWRNEFLASAYMRYQRQVVVQEKTTWYFGRRANAGTRRNNVLTVYADRPSKINNAQPVADLPPCLHIEWRIFGSAALAAKGIVSLDDLIHFDHQRFWNDHIRLYQLPKPTALGRLLAKDYGADTNISGSALRKRATRWKLIYSIQKKFVMHNALLDKPNIRRFFIIVRFSGWLKATVSL